MRKQQCACNADRIRDIHPFDAIGGGALGSAIVQAMERAALRGMSDYSRYGSSTFKQLYIDGALDLGPTMLNRLAFGFQWSVGGWLLFPFLEKAGCLNS